jgi:alpha-tubulin suppressor-like RCC1 family protein
VKEDGSLWAWGDNAAGQLGDGTLAGRPIPGQIGGHLKWKSVSAGERHTVALAKDGSLWAWGANDFGQLGLDSPTNTLIPVRVLPQTIWSAVAAGDNFTSAVAQDGRLWLWGSMIEPLPDHVVAQAPAPVSELSAQQMSALRTQADADIVEATSRLGGEPLRQPIAAGERHSAFIKPDGSLWAWGGNESGQLGDGTVQPRSRPVRIGDAADWTSVAAGDRHTLALKRDGTLWSWGADDFGQSGRGGGSPAPMQVGTGRTWFAIACGAGHALALQRNGSLWAWGWNHAGQAGNFGTENVAVPSAVCIGSDARSASADRKWNSIAAGLAHSTAIRTDGFWTWGLNESGQLGILVHGKTPNRYSPSQVSPAGTWRAVAPGGAHTLGIQSDGSLWTWGDNRNGQLGTGSTEASPTPIRVGNAVWKAVAAGEAHSAGVQQDGTLWAWGRNAAGQLGFLTASDELSPLKVDAATDWVAVAAGRTHTIAIKADGSIWAWGRWTVNELESGGGAISFGGKIAE